jgi:hypothetical protein
MSNTRYETVCPRATGSGVLESYKQELYCGGDDVTTWDSKINEFRAKFEKARDCGLLRIQRMKSYGAATPQEIANRRSHVFPIQVAYTYAKDCLRKLPTTNTGYIKGFENEFHNEIIEAGRYHPNIVSKQAFGDGIEKSIQNARPTADMFEVQQLLNKSYYTPDAWKIIYNGRNADMEEHKMSLKPDNNSHNKQNTRWKKQNNYEKLRQTHWGKTRKQRKLKTKRKSRRNG